MDYDKYGHCVLCHRNLILEQVIDQKVQKRFHVDREETEFKLDDGSKMRVCICRPCKHELTEEKYKKVMDSVIKGWQVEVSSLDWAKEKKEKHMEVYSKRKIVENTEKSNKVEVENGLNK